MGFTLPDDLAAYVEAWSLVPEGPVVQTPTSALVSASHRGHPAMLKVARVAEEAGGNRALVAWAGRGAAPVFHHDERAVLMLRATGTRNLRTMAIRGGRGDDQATRILASAAHTLHEVACAVPPGATDLRRWFADLFAHADDVGGCYARAADLALHLLDHPRGQVLLHGDIHHGNVLDFCEHGWLAIDPKGLVGDPAFDYANILCNPAPAVATRPGRPLRQLRIIAQVSGIDEHHLARWAVAWCALSAAWIEREPGTTSGNNPAHARATLTVAHALATWLAE